MAKADYVMKDLAGYLFNGKYLPDYSHNGGLYHGYKNSVEETLFYDFAVQGYDLAFSYKGKRYYLMSDPEYVALSDEHFTQEFQRFDNYRTPYKGSIKDCKRKSPLSAVNTGKSGERGTWH